MASFHVLGDIQAEGRPTAVDRVAEQTHLHRLVAKVVGNLVLVEDLGLARNDGGADEVAGLRQDLAEVVVADVTHHSSSVR